MMNKNFARRLMVSTLSGALIASSSIGCAKKEDAAATDSSTSTTTTTTCTGTWSTLDDYQYVTGKGSGARGIYRTTAGVITVVGYGFNSSNVQHWIARQSSDGGKTWTTVDDAERTTGNGGRALAISGDDSSTLYAAGFGYDTAYTSDVGYIRRSTDGGATWSSYSQFNPIGNYDSTGTAVAVDSSSKTAFWAGYTSTTVSNYTWYLGKRPVGGASSAIESFQYTGGTYSVANALHVDSSSNVYVGGYGRDGSAVDRWLVRKGASGASLSTVDAYLYTGGTSSSVNGLGMDSSSNLYAVGYGKDATARHWVARKGETSGTTWSTIDDYQLASGKDATATAFGLDSKAVFYTSGYATDSSSKIHWIVRSSKDGATWANSDDYQLATDKKAYAFGMAAGADAVMYVVGEADDSTDKAHWVVRKYECK